jgi:DNA-binding MarR family transcriptional regulator
MPRGRPPKVKEIIIDSSLPLDSITIEAVEQLRLQKDQFLGRIFTKSYWLMSQITREYMVQIGYDTSRLSHVPILLNIPDKGLTVKELAALTGVSTQAAGQRVKELEAMNYVKTSRNRRDGRAIDVVLTRKGTDFIWAWKECMAFAEQELIRVLGSEEKFTQLRELLSELANFWDSKGYAPINDD